MKSRGGSAEGCLRVCRTLHSGDDLFAKPSSPSSAMPPQAAPGDRHLISFVFNQMAGHCCAKLAKLFCRDEWNVGIVAQPVDALLNRGRLKNVTWLGPRTGTGASAHRCARHRSAHRASRSSA